MACRTPRDALNAYLVHAPWIASGGEWELHEEAENATLYYHRTGLPDDCSRMIIDGVISALVAFGRSFAPGKDPIEVRFRHAEPSYAERYAAVFRCPVHFGSPRNAIVFARAVLERTQLYADETMVAEFHDTVTRLLHRSGGGEVTERVRLLLRAHDDLGAVYVAEYARRFGVSERTLRNWLGQEGGTFSQLVDQERCRRAAFELRKKGASISEIAQRVGFTERSAFHRAFKRWTGMTPAEYMASYDR
jgi:AraC-like DNA-binding protein